MTRTAFFVYPSDPPFIGDGINQAAAVVGEDGHLRITPWPKLNVIGLKIDDLIRDKIASADFLIADITYPNFNVYYEIGYAIGCQKPLIATVNVAVEKAPKNVGQTGIFDTIGQLRYQNSSELAEQLLEANADPWANHYLRDKDHNQPLFFLDTLAKTDFRNYIVHSINNSSVRHRPFDPGEIPRLSLPRAIADISSSAGIIIPLISNEISDWQRHNLRAAFLAGMSHGFHIETLIIQYEDKPSPLDYRDFINTTRLRVEVEQLVEEYCEQTLIRNQQRTAIFDRRDRTLLDQIDIGASAAEGESERLGLYFIRTAEFYRAVRSNASIVVGRKGSGKSAIFFQVAEDRLKDSRNLVLDLRPASHNLSELRHELLGVTNLGIFDHTIAALWQYLLYAEIILKIREGLLPKAKYNFSTLNRIRDLEEQFHLTNEMVAGDFTSRLESAVRSIVKTLGDATPEGDLRHRLTNILFEGDIAKLRDAIATLGGNFQSIVLLIDDLDKGWPPKRLETHDVRMLQHLIDVLHKMQRELQRREIDLQFLLFLRSDVYENLVEQTADRGKYNLIQVDWSDQAQLENLIRVRVVSSVSKADAVQAWEAINPRLIEGETAISKMIESSLRRPRYLIDLCEKALSFAINRGHSVVGADDVEDALKQMSLHLVSDFGYEVRDISGISEDIFYSFIGTSDTLTPDEVKDTLGQFHSSYPVDQVVDLLVWYGFLGIPDSNGHSVFIYDREYDIRRMDAERKRYGRDLLYVVNPAFLRGLQK